MKLFILILLILVISKNSSAQSQSDVELKIDSYIQPYLDLSAWSGVISISKNGEYIFQKAYRYADREWNIPNTLDTKFRIASISKVFTEVAILKLVESGKISLNDRLSKFIPDYPRGEEITVQHLLTHRSGISHLNSFPDYNKLIKNEYQLNEIISLFKNKALEFEPGKRFSYSNSGYVLLAFIIENTSGYSYDNFLKEEIFSKTNLQNTGIDDNNRILKKRARGYMFDTTGTLINAEYVNMSIKIGGGSLYSTADDLNQFVQQLLQKKIISNPLSELPNISDNNGVTIFTANGRVQGFCHQITHRVKDSLTIIVLGNHYSNIALPIADDLFKIYSGQTYQIPTNYFAQKVNVPFEDLKKFEGSYDFGFGPVGKVELRGSDLTYLAPGRDRPDNLIPIGNNKFFYPQNWVLLEFYNLEGDTYNSLDWIMGENTYPAKKINE